MSRSGYTLPVFACAAAVAALHWLRYHQPLTVTSVDLITPAEIAEIPIEQVAGISENQALAMTRSDPGDNLDLTKNTPIWAMVAGCMTMLAPKVPYSFVLANSTAAIK